MKRKGFPIDAMFDIRMPDTWTPIFDLSDPEKVAERNRKADVEITEVIGMISNKRPREVAIHSSGACIQRLIVTQP